MSVCQIVDSHSPIFNNIEKFLFSLNNICFIDNCRKPILSIVFSNDICDITTAAVLSVESQELIGAVRIIYISVEVSKTRYFT